MSKSTPDSTILSLMTAVRALSHMSNCELLPQMLVIETKAQEGGYTKDVVRALIDAGIVSEQIHDFDTLVAAANIRN